MICGCCVPGQFPNQSLGLPIRIGGKDVIVRIKPTYKVGQSLTPKYAPRLKRLPKV